MANILKKRSLESDKRFKSYGALCKLYIYSGAQKNVRLFCFFFRKKKKIQKKIQKFFGLKKIFMTLRPFLRILEKSMAKRPFGPFHVPFGDITKLTRRRRRFFHLKKSIFRFDSLRCKCEQQTNRHYVEASRKRGGRRNGHDLGHCNGHDQDHHTLVPLTH